LNNLLSELSFLFQRVNWLSIVDILLVTVIFYILLIMLKDTQAVVLLRGVIFLLIFMSALASLGNLPAFSWRKFAGHWSVLDALAPLGCFSIAQPWLGMNMKK
jgi:DNA integrity scanning protein DisA with diadenylate cyclase activity